MYNKGATAAYRELIHLMDTPSSANTFIDTYEHEKENEPDMREAFWSVYNDAVQGAFIFGFNLATTFTQTDNDEGRK